ncbi:MAG TPA: pyridoxal kinase [Gaiellales bacterium]|jgi:pyridoxine kinase|nr:pyridoxal kinase [Gaiellales bacterium]
MRSVRAVMSIQSSVVYGHVGSTAATVPLHRLGFDVWALPTVVYSSHAGYPGVRGSRTPVSTLRELLAGLQALGRLDRCEAVLSGYLGQPDTWPFVLEALAAVREQRPDAWFVCDPVLGDEGELYMPEELVRTFREQAVPRADLLVPNRFELEWLVGRPVRSVDEAVGAARELHAAGAREVVVKGLVLDHEGRPMQHVVGLDDDGAWLARAPHVPQFWSGAGDVFTALLAGLRLRGTPLSESVARATALMEALVARTYELGAPELRLVEIDWASEPAGAHATRVA